MAGACLQNFKQAGWPCVELPGLHDVGRAFVLGALSKLPVASKDAVASRDICWSAESWCRSVCEAKSTWLYVADNVAGIPGHSSACCLDTTLLCLQLTSAARRQ